jgi:hypothetical protein
MTNFRVYEDDGSVDEELRSNPAIKVGDTIEYFSNNQMGYLKYSVILGENGEKSLKVIATYDDQFNGGKRRKRKTNKRRKSHQKRKTQRKKTYKRRKQ